MASRRISSEFFAVSASRPQAAPRERATTTAPPLPPQALSPSEVLRRARANVEHIGRAGDILVEGELFDVRTLRNGHMTFELKDTQAALPCVLFAAHARRVPFELEQGQKVIAFGKPSVSDWAKVQLKVSRLEPVGEGRLELAFRQLKERLEREGLFAPERKRVPPFLPRTVGVVTSTHGAALFDVVKVLWQRMPAMPIVVSETRVQGDGAAQEIAAALKRLDAARCCDVILLVRGGGSLEDLWAFNTEPVARAIAACTTPVIAGVGHETDVTIADLVADVRAATPSHAAERAVPRSVDLHDHLDKSARRLAAALTHRTAVARSELARLQQRLEDPRHALARRRRSMEELQARLHDAVARRCVDARRELVTARTRLERRSPAHAVSEQRTTLALLHAHLEPAIRSRHHAATNDLKVLVARLSSISPLAVLARGYAIARRASDGTVVRTPSDAPAGTELAIRVERGTVYATTRSADVENTVPHPVDSDPKSTGQQG